MIVFELWDTETANLVGAYETEEEALAVVRRAMATHGEQYASGLALLKDDDGEEMETLAVGSALAARASTGVAAKVGIAGG
jgi:hypothetical protein